MICKDRLDGLMEQFRFQPDGITETAFYIAYHAAREIIDTGHKKKDPARDADPSRAASASVGRAGRADRRSEATVIRS